MAQLCLKKKKEKTHNKNHSLCQICHYNFFSVQLPDVLHYIIKLIDLVLFLHLPLYNNKYEYKEALVTHLA